MSKEVIILGLGLNPENDLTLKAYKTLKEAKKIYLRTEVHTGIDFLKKENIEYTSFDYLYESEEDFDELYKKMAEEVINAPYESVVFAVPGSCVYAEKSAVMIANDKRVKTRIINSISFVDGVFSSLKVDALNLGYKVIDALSIDTQKPDPYSYTIVCQVYNRMAASDLKLRLMEFYDEETDIYLVNALTTNEERIKEIKLYDLDREEVDHLSSVVIPPVNYKKSLSQMDSFMELIRFLRSDKGCPWDRKQTHESLKPYLLEECYEVFEAIDEDDDYALMEELGDVLLQIILHCSIGEEDSAFNLYDVTKGIGEKIIRRHPYVFSDVTLEGEDTSKVWKATKKEEKKYESYTDTLISVPKTFPSLMYAAKVQKRAGDANFDFESYKESLDKVYEELEEFKNELKNKTDGLFDEAGDILFSIVNTFRMLGIDSEAALKKSSEKFIDRFRVVEELVNADNLELLKINGDLLDKYWKKSKNILK